MPHPLRVACLALDPRTGDVAGNLAQARRGLARAAELGVELLALPEMWPTSFTAAADDREVAAGESAVRALAEDARASGIVIVGSAYAAAGAGALPVNRAHVCAGGEVLAHYDKVHLFSPTGERLAFSAGDSPPPAVATPRALVAPIVCYDLRFPDLVRAPIRAGAEVLAVVAQWPRERAAHWRALVAGRAAEGQCFVVAANRAGRDEIGRKRTLLEFDGNGLVAGPDGRILASGDASSDLVVADIDLDEARELRRRVPVLDDERRELYRRWSSTPASQQ